MDFMGDLEPERQKGRGEIDRLPGFQRNFSVQEDF
jgi:hypothetical protein